MTDKPVIDRRAFLSKLTAVAAGTASLAVTSSLTQAAPVPNQEQATPIDIPKAKGYQRTEHVDTYYQLADF